MSFTSQNNSNYRCLSLRLWINRSFTFPVTLKLPNGFVGELCLLTSQKRSSVATACEKPVYPSQSQMALNKIKPENRHKYLVLKVRTKGEPVYLVFTKYADAEEIMALARQDINRLLNQVLFTVYNGNAHPFYCSIGKHILASVRKGVSPSIAKLLEQPSITEETLC